MFARAAVSGLALAALTAGCTEHVTLNDLWDAAPDAASVPDGGGPRDAGVAPDGPFHWGSDACAAAGFAPQGAMAEAAQVLFLLDRSQGMQGSLGAKTREQAAEDAISAAVKQYQGQIKFGFEQFPADLSGDHAAAKQCPAHGTCCPGSVVVEPNENNSQAMSSYINCGSPQGTACPATTPDAPSQAALGTALGYYNSHPSWDDKYVVLVTSSDPSCAGSSSDPCDGAVSAAHDLGNMGVQVVVFSVGWQPSANSCLMRISQVGSSSSVSNLPNNTSLYASTSSDVLNTQMGAFVSAVASNACTVDLSPYVTTDPSLVVVSFPSSTGPGFEAVPQATQTSGSWSDGWHFVNAGYNRMTFTGQYCTEIVDSSVRISDISIGFSCSTCGGPNACPTFHWN